MHSQKKTERSPLPTELDLLQKGNRPFNWMLAITAMGVAFAGLGLVLSGIGLKIPFTIDEASAIRTIRSNLLSEAKEEHKLTEKAYAKTCCYSSILLNSEYSCDFGSTQEPLSPALEHIIETAPIELANLTAKNFVRDTQKARFLFEDGIVRTRREANKRNLERFDQVCEK